MRCLVSTLLEILDELPQGVGYGAVHGEVSTLLEILEHLHLQAWLLVRLCVSTLFEILGHRLRPLWRLLRPLPVSTLLEILALSFIAPHADVAVSMFQPFLRF